MPPRTIQPKSEPETSDSIDGAGETKGGKRRVISSACIPCRKRKSKCDGQLPSCSTCIAVHRTECCYGAESDHRRKGALKRDIQPLQQQSNALDVIVASLRSLPEQESIALLYSLRGDCDPNALADTLRSNVGLPHSFAPQTLEADLTQQVTTISSVDHERPNIPPPLSREVSEDSTTYSIQSTRAAVHDATTWFRTPTDAEFVEHLLALYRCWVDPFYCFVSWDLFSQDMVHGRTDFCSSMLINAVLSFACHYSDRPLARIDPNDSGTAGDQFYAEAKRLLDQIDKPSLPTVQALGIMSLRETSAGRDSSGYQLAGRCVRMALEIGLHLSAIKNGMRPNEAEARKLTFWAVFKLETICAVVFGRLSQLPRSVADIETPFADARSETQTWRPYEDVNVSNSPSGEQPARAMSFDGQLTKLSELASDMVNTFYAPGERFTSRRLAITYSYYQDWYLNLPEHFRLENTSLPHVLVLHMYYYGCVLHLFRPYIKLDLRAANLYPLDTCTYCANEISALMNALRAKYGLRRIALAVVSLVLSASKIHLLNLPAPQSAAHLSQSLHDLEAMSVNHRSAARAVDIVRSLSSKWNIALSKDAAAASVYRMELQRETSPPSTSFAASIPRKGSSEGRARSGDSGHNESPFAPPDSTAYPSQHQQQPHQKPEMGMFYSDPTTPLDPNQAQTAFWTPFSTHPMPMPHHDMGSAMMDHAGLQDQQHWQSYGGASAAQQQDYHGIQQPAPPRLDDDMTGMGDWNWSQ